MSTSTWEGPEVSSGKKYPVSLSRSILTQMMQRFNAQGVCIALYDEDSEQMKVLVHLRLKQTQTSGATRFSFSPKTTQRLKESQLDEIEEMTRPMVAFAAPNGSSSQDSSGVLTTQNQKSDGDDRNDIEEVTPQQSEFFSVGSSYTIGQGLIGSTWYKREPVVLRHDRYSTDFAANHGGLPSQPALPQRYNSAPSQYLALPIEEPVLPGSGREVQSQQNATMLGIIVLYRLDPSASSFQEQRDEAMRFVRQMAVYLQNEQLRYKQEHLQHKQQRMSGFLHLLQEVSTAFPTSVQLADLVENVYHFATQTVDVSSMLLTLYDRDLDRLYDVFALNKGQRLEHLPVEYTKGERPTWWEITQNQKQKLVFSPAQEQGKAYEYRELLMGSWGEQFQAESFILLPMKMFNRVIGALCLTSKKAHAYHDEEIQVLETMLQIVTVSIENAKLYERDRHIIQTTRKQAEETRKREEELAVMNSALQSTNSVLNVNVLLDQLVRSAAAVAKVNLSVFFQPSPDNERLIASALYAPSSVSIFDDGSGLPEVMMHKTGEPDLVINLIQFPFKGTFLERLTQEGFFYLDPARIEELAPGTSEGGQIFLQEMAIEYMLMIPMVADKHFIGFLAVPTPPSSKTLRPNDVITLVAICAQSAAGIRNARLFEQREEAYAKLEQMDKLKDEFLVTASHELRTPLTAISGYASQLNRMSTRATPQQILRFATRISTAAQQLNDLLSSMTEAAEIGPSDRKMDLHLEPVQMLSAAEIARNMLTNATDHTININVARDLWVFGDAPRVRQVLTNLLENATKYSLPGTYIDVHAEVVKLSYAMSVMSKDQVDHELGIEHGNDTVVLVRVSDQGQGVLDEDRQIIFDKFVRAPRSLTTPTRGSGLGLYICRRYVEAMQGRLWLEKSVLNGGSTFSFYLPQAQTPVEDPID